MLKNTILIFFTLFFIIDFMQISDAAIINEIMYNPDQCSDTYCEWIEIYNPSNDSINLSGLYISDWNGNLTEETNRSMDFINTNTTMIEGDEFFIIAKNPANFSQYWNVSCPVAKANVILNNDQEIITLYSPNDSLIDRVYYNSSWSVHGNNKTLEKINSTGENSIENWVESSIDGGTPCSENKPTNKTSNESETSDFKLHITVNNTEFSVGESVKINGNFTNTYKQPVLGNLTVKFKEITMDDYPDDWIILNKKEILIPEGISDLNNLINEGLEWLIPDNAISGQYKVYARFDSDIKNTLDYEYFYVHGLGNIFIKSWNISSSNLSLENNTSNITVEILNNESEKYSVNITLVLKNIKTISKGTHDEFSNCGEFFIINGTSRILNCELRIPSDVITNGTEEFEIYPILSFVYGDSKIIRDGDKVEINITGFKDLGESYLEIFSKPNQVKFGDFSTIFAKFYSGNYNYSKIRFLAYGYPSQILMDLDGNGLTASSYNSNVVVEINNMQRDQNLYITTPLFLKQNCDNNYNSDIYRVRIRAYSLVDSDWKEIETRDFNLSVSGRNEIFCPQKTKEPAKPTITENVFVSKKEKTEEPYEIISCPTEVRPDEEFSVKVKISNKFNESKNFTVYSYVYDGKKLLSLGFGEKWEKTWNSNEKTIKLSSGESAFVDLRNKISNDTNPSSYKLRARIKADGKEYDITKDITVLQKLSSQKIENLSFQFNVIQSNDNLFINTECEDCKLLIFTPKNEFEIGDKNFTINTLDNGLYHFLLTKNYSILERKTVNITKNVENEDYTNQTTKVTSNIPTGGFLENALGRTLNMSIIDIFINFLHIIF